MGLKWFQIQPVKIKYGICKTIRKVNIEWIIDNIKELLLFKVYKSLFLMAQTVKNLPPMQETRVWSLGWEDTLEEGMVTHSSILAWRIPWTEESRGLQSIGLQRVGHDWSDLAHTWVRNTSLKMPKKIKTSSTGHLSHWIVIKALSQAEGYTDDILKLSVLDS